YCYDTGLGIHRNSAEAKRWYRRAARGGLAVAALNMAVLSREHGDARGERRWWRKAAELGDVEAKLLLAKRIITSPRAGTERSEALKFIRKIARSPAIPERDDATRLLADFNRGGQKDFRVSEKANRKGRV